LGTIKKIHQIFAVESLETSKAFRIPNIGYGNEKAIKPVIGPSRIVFKPEARFGLGFFQSLPMEEICSL